MVDLFIFDEVVVGGGDVYDKVMIEIVELFFEVEG